MRSYRINMDRLVNQLVPHYLGGRKLILFLQSILQPLNSLNIGWVTWADEKRIEAAMTSQVIMMEYFLNRKFGKYFLNTSERIVISDGVVNGVPIYWEASNEDMNQFPLYKEGESEIEGHPSVPLRWKDEKTPTGDVSFVVSCPTINTKIVSQEEFTAMISFYIDRYRIAGKNLKVLYI